MTIDRKQLIKKCKHHDPGAQRILYDLFKSKLMGVCRRYSASREEAQDILQEVFIKVFTRIEQVDDSEKLEGWMMKIAINTAISYYNKSKKQDLKDIELVQAESEDYQLILSGLSDEFLMRLINSLPDGCRLIFNLSVVEGYTHGEIAAMLDISDSTSRSQLSYAKCLLKEKLITAGVTQYEKYA